MGIGGCSVEVLDASSGAAAQSASAYLRVPIIGDLASPLFTIGILWQGRDLGIPKVVQLRMIVNAAIDAIVGAIPVAGDLFDFAWKSNTMNLALLELHAYEEHRASPGDWLFVIAMILLVVLIAAVPFIVAGWLIATVLRSDSRLRASSSSRQRIAMASADG